MKMPYYKSLISTIDMKTRLIRKNWNDYAAILDMCKTYHFNAVVGEDMKNIESAIVKLTEQLWSELQYDYKFGGEFTLLQHLYYRYKVLKMKQNNLSILISKVVFNYLLEMGHLLCSKCRHSSDEKTCEVIISKENVIGHIGVCVHAINAYGTNLWQESFYNKTIEEYAIEYCKKMQEGNL